jgi:NAD(P)-dependent dehydrogenase (short-subunit alcohol dehydrogenase family)
MAKHVIVTGGAGFIGSHLVERLLSDGRPVVVIDDLSTGCLANLDAVRSHPQLRILQGRVSACGELTKLAGEAESIYHLAAAVGVELVLDATVQSIRTSGRTCAKRRPSSKPPANIMSRCCWPPPLKFMARAPRNPSPRMMTC